MSGFPAGVVLALESSCDETAVALFDPAAGLAGEWVSSQVRLHATYGGVVPELASREHLENLGPLLGEAWAVVPPSRIGSVAVTAGPGLAPCLALGLTAAKALVAARGWPLVPVHHLRAHAWSVFLPVHAADPAAFDRALDGLLPHLGLLVSGGHTQLIEVGVDRSLRLVATTTDDAAGEALDKGGKLLGLGYPGGPLVERWSAAGSPSAFRFPRPLPERTERRFSFSGLKTALRVTVESLGAEAAAERRADLCASYQAAVFDALVRKLREAVADVRPASVGLSGGVANNRTLRRMVAAEAEAAAVPFLAAKPEHTGDNAAMIAFAAWAGGVEPAAEPWAVDVVPDWVVA